MVGMFVCLRWASQKLSDREFFIPAGTHLGVKLLTIQSCCATFWLIVACGGAGSGAPFQPWDVGGRHGRWVHGLLVFTLRYERDFQKTLKSLLLISSHPTSAAETSNMASMANRAYRSRGGPCTTCMCRRCCRWCSALAVRPSLQANITDDALSTRSALDKLNITNNDTVF